VHQRSLYLQEGVRAVTPEEELRALAERVRQLNWLESRMAEALLAEPSDDPQDES
jgi:hypothetical protein